MVLKDSHRDRGQMRFAGYDYLWDQLGGGEDVGEGA
jgi:hypothetical protein